MLKLLDSTLGLLGIKRLNKMFAHSGIFMLVGLACTQVLRYTAPEMLDGILQAEFLSNHYFGHDHGDGHYVLSLPFLVNDFFIAFFFGIAFKEVKEAIFLPGGALQGKKAYVPISGTLGGVLGPAGVFLLAVALLGKWTLMWRGFAIPMATDIAFTYLFAKMIFPDVQQADGTMKKHRMVSFGLALAILDDLIGMAMIAFFYNDGIDMFWLGLFGATIPLGILMNRLKVQGWGWYIVLLGLPGIYFLFHSGLHPSLGLAVAVFCMPTKGRDEDGIVAEGTAENVHHSATADRYEHQTAVPVEYILGAFAFVNAGVNMVQGFNTLTFVVLGSLIIGKGLFIWAFTRIAQRFWEFEASSSEVMTLALAAGIGFTVSLFVASLAYAPGALQDGAKIGAALSLIAGPMAMVYARMFHVGRWSREIDSTRRAVLQ